MEGWRDNSFASTKQNIKGNNSNAGYTPEECFIQELNPKKTQLEKNGEKK